MTKMTVYFFQPCDIISFSLSSFHAFYLLPQILHIRQCTPAVAAYSTLYNVIYECYAHTIAAFTVDNTACHYEMYAMQYIFRYYAAKFEITVRSCFIAVIRM